MSYDDLDVHVMMLRDEPRTEAYRRALSLEVRPDDELVVLDALSQKYLGTDFPRRKWSSRVVLVIEPHLARAYRSSLRDPRSEVAPPQA